MIRIKRITALALAILAFFIFVGSPFGQSAKAVVGVDDAIIAIIIAGLAAVGITFFTTGGYSTLEEYVSSLLSEYAASRNVSVDSLLSGCQAGSNKYGKIVINNRFVVLISAFAAFLQAKFGLQNNEYYNVVQVGYTFGNVVVYHSPFDSYGYNGYHTVFTNSVEAYYVVVDDGRSGHTGNYGIYVVSEVQTIPYNNVYMSPQNAVLNTYTGNYTGGRTGTINGLSYDTSYYVTLISTQGVEYLNRYMPEVVVVYYQDFIAMLNENRDIDYNNVGIDIVTDGIVLPLDDSNYEEGDGAIIDVGADWGTTIGDITDETIPDAFSDGKEGEATITYESEDAVEDQVENTLQQEISQDVSDYQSPGLQDVFPFCIPFDIYAFFECLAADPVAPSFTWRFYVPRICDEEFTVDLAPFNTVAQIVRTMELLAFIVGLALVTRDKFLRG